MQVAGAGNDGDSIFRSRHRGKNGLQRVPGKVGRIGAAKCNEHPAYLRVKAVWRCMEKLVSQAEIFMPVQKTRVVFLAFVQCIDHHICQIGSGSFILEIDHRDARFSGLPYIPGQYSACR